MILTSLTLLWPLWSPAPSATEALAEPGLTALLGPSAAQRGQRGQGRGRGSSGRSAPKRKSGKRLLGPSSKPQSSKAKGGSSKGKKSSKKKTEQRVSKPTPQELRLPAAEPDAQIREWFAIADYDLNDWVSFREAKQSLSFDRLRFRVYDTDRDGRIRFAEFKAFHDDSVYRGGKFREPAPQAGQARPPQRAPELLRNAYDLDLDGEIGLLELARILVDYGRDDVTAETALAGLDTDDSERLNPQELVGLTGILHPIVLPAATEADPEQPRPQSINELFGRVSLRHEGIRSAPTPPLIVGPVSHFRRMDVNDDGVVSVTDLEGLLRPLQLRVRVHSVISTLDRDGDGVLSREEFDAAMSDYVE